MKKTKPLKFGLFKQLTLFSREVIKGMVSGGETPPDPLGCASYEKRFFSMKCIIIIIGRVSSLRRNRGGIRCAKSLSVGGQFLFRSDVNIATQPARDVSIEPERPQSGAFVKRPRQHFQSNRLERTKTKYGALFFFFSPKKLA